MASRREVLGLLAAAMPLARPLQAGAQSVSDMSNDRLVLSDFRGETDQVLANARWRGFSDRVMGGVSDATLRRDRMAGVGCIRLTGRVTRDNGGGFIQMALDLGTRSASFDASAFAGIEFLVYGNDEDYNVHLRTADCGWYDESYRATVRIGPGWQRLRLAWGDFKPNGDLPPLDAARLQRIAVLGWMREFVADVALAELALYG